MGIVDDARHHTTTGGDNKKAVEFNVSPRAAKQKGEEWIIPQRRKKK
jgi:hypothetical protein